jgi:hypothetical protein
MPNDTTTAANGVCPGEDADVKALLRLLTYAFAEASNLGLDGCAELIHRAAGEVRQQIGGLGYDPTATDTTHMH